MENIEKHNKGYPVFSPLRENDCYHFSFFFFQVLFCLLKICIYFQNWDHTS